MNLRTISRHAPWLFPAALVASIAPGCGQGNSLVGGVCAAGYVQCGDRCVISDEANCGACGAACAAGAACIAGRCAAVDGAIPSPDGAADADASESIDGSTADATTPLDAEDAEADTTLPDATSDGGPSDDSSVDGAASDASDDVDSGCNPPFDTPDHCGDCQTQCAGATPRCAPDGAGSFVCAPPCDPGQEACGGVCTDVTSDPSNCSACGVVCPSQICSQSKCVGTTPGGIVFIGHDYQSTPAGTAQARVLANAVFLGEPRGPAADHVEVLSYERYADAANVAQIKALLAASTPAGRVLDITSTTNDGDVANLTFAAYSVLLIPDQSNASAGVDLGALGASWASALASFAQTGGVVVVLDGGTGAAQMPALVSGTGLLDITSQAPLATGTPIRVFSPGDAVGVGVVSPYAAGMSSVTVDTEPNGGNVVYVVGPSTDAALAPVVVHKVF